MPLDAHTLLADPLVEVVELAREAAAEGKAVAVAGMKAAWAGTVGAMASAAEALVVDMARAAAAVVDAEAEVEVTVAVGEEASTARKPCR